MGVGDDGAATGRGAAGRVALEFGAVTASGEWGAEDESGGGATAGTGGIAEGRSAAASATVALGAASREAPRYASIVLRCTSRNVRIVSWNAASTRSAPGLAPAGAEGVAGAGAAAWPFEPVGAVGVMGVFRKA